jgi:hypothetical protein
MKSALGGGGVDSMDIDDEEISLTPLLISTNDGDIPVHNGGGDLLLTIVCSNSRLRFQIKKVTGVESIQSTKEKFCCKCQMEQEMLHTTKVWVNEHGNPISDAKAMEWQQQYMEQR